MSFNKFKYRNQILENTSKKSLLNLYIDVNEKGKTSRICALSHHWIELNRSYQSYYQYNVFLDNSIFNSKNQWYLQELSRLLRMSQHEFLCYMIFEPKVTAMLGSFLMTANNPYDWIYINKNVETTYFEIYQKVIKIYLRLIYEDPSKIEYLTKDELIPLVIKNKLINLGSLVDICRLYGNANSSAVTYIMNYFYSGNTEIFIDSSKLITCMVEDLKTQEFECGQSEIGESGKMYIRRIVSVLHTLFYFVKFYPKSYTCFMDNEHLEILRRFHGNIYNFYEFIEEDTKCVVNFKKLLNLIRMYICKIYKEINKQILKEMVNKRNPREFVLKCFKTYCNELKESILLTKFFNDYKIFYDPEEDFSHIVSLYSLFEGYGLENTVQELNDLLNGMPPKLDKIALRPEYVDYSKEPWIAISTVKEAFPDLDAGTIKYYLQNCNNNPEQVVNAILESNLAQFKGEKSKNSNSKNTKDVDALDLLEDKSFVKEMKISNNTYSKFGLGLGYDEYDDYYNDEYDDSYDQRDVMVEPKTESDLGSAKESSKSSKTNFLNSTVISKGNPNKPKTYLKDDLWSEGNQNKIIPHFEDDIGYIDNSDLVFISCSSEDSDDDTSGHIKSGPNHKQNIVRKRADVVGKPKGQGQDEKVLQNRAKKNEHKATRANHNRKGGARWKRNQGMFS